MESFSRNGPRPLMEPIYNSSLNNYMLGSNPIFYIWPVTQLQKTREIAALSAYCVTILHNIEINVYN
ncbi:MAG: hypothetical protein Tsb004_21140 [Allomuricauda sp.]